jgi:hypothetical protein
VTRDELLDLLSRLRCAPIGRAHLRAPHKPLLLLWLFGRFSAIGSTVASYADAEEPVSALINEFGPRMASAAAARRRWGNADKCSSQFLRTYRRLRDCQADAALRSAGAQIVMFCGPIPNGGSGLQVMQWCRRLNVTCAGHIPAGHARGERG